VKFGCLKIAMCSEDSSMVGKHDSIRDSGNTCDNATWDSSKLKCEGRLSFGRKSAITFYSQLSFI
jgi:hypothetical protein